MFESKFTKAAPPEPKLLVNGLELPNTDKYLKVINTDSKEISYEDIKRRYSVM